MFKYLYSIAILFLITSTYLLFDSRSAMNDAIEKADKLENKIKGLEWELSHSKETSTKKSTRIKDLIQGYPTGIWSCNDNADSLVFEKEIKNPTLEKMVSELNKIFVSYQNPEILILSKVNKTIHIGIEDPEQVAERMGSTGALCYLGQVVYSLTSLKDVVNVDFKFDEGSHASPGLYERFSFELQ